MPCSKLECSVLRAMHCRIVKLVRALRKGWIKREKDEVKEPEVYLMWAEDGNAMERSSAGKYGWTSCY